MPEPTGSWQLDGFLDRFDEWVELENPTQDQRTAALDWVVNRHVDPYAGARREFENYWFARVPYSIDDKGRAVACSYWIRQATRTVECDRFATLSLPF